VDKALLTGLAMPDENRGYRYQDMIRYYRTMHKTVLLPAVEKNDITGTAQQEQRAVKLLGEVIDLLEEEAGEHGLLNNGTKSNKSNANLPCVLCHMDLQPQNLVFAKQQQQQLSNETIITAVSVLDWEDAAWADPRFELLLMCRKVLANHQQAQQLWDLYQEQTGIVLGELEPWLKLEAVHSLTTLLLQACAGGGRSPWEARAELWNKIQREFQRLVGLGWKLCMEFEYEQNTTRARKLSP